MAESKSSSGKMIAAAIAVIGIGASILASQSAADRAEAHRIAEAAEEAARQTATLELLLKSSRGALQSLATLFNGSGRVSAEEFTGTIDALRSRSDALFPDEMGFVTRSTPESCETDDGCWLVSYSTAEDGLLKPGADLSRFAPTATTIKAAINDQNVMKIGSVYREADGASRSFLAVTIKNTRQFGVLLSEIDYDRVIAELQRQWLPNGLSLTVAARFDDGAGGMSDTQQIYASPDGAGSDAATLETSLSLDHAEFALTWSVLPGFRSGSAALPNMILFGGIVTSVLAAALAGIIMGSSRKA